MTQENSTIKRRKFKHLNKFQRGQIQALLKVNMPKTKIAQIVGISRSTLYEELKRGTVKQMDTNLKVYYCYFADTGQNRYERNRENSRKPYKLAQCSDFIQYLEKQFLKHKVPIDSICGQALRKGVFKAVICTKTAYNYISQQLIKVRSIDLPLRVKLKQKVRHDRKRRRVLGQSIELRPNEINERNTFGHWEIDTVVGKREKSQVLLTIDERLTRKRHIVKIADKSSMSVKKGLQKIMKLYGNNAKAVFKSITADNGSEFSQLEAAAKDAKIYYAHPYSSFERGTNEKQNSLVRRFIPKGADMNKVSHFVVKKVQNWINELPRKIFDYRSSKELFDEQLSMLNISL